MMQLQNLRLYWDGNHRFNPPIWIQLVSESLES
jgi:hypothetical protein